MHVPPSLQHDSFHSILLGEADGYMFDPMVCILERP